MVLGEISPDEFKYNDWHCKRTSKHVSAESRKYYVSTCLRCGKSDGVARIASNAKVRLHRCCGEANPPRVNSIKSGEIINGYTVIIDGSVKSIVCNTCKLEKKFSSKTPFSRSVIKKHTHGCCSHSTGIMNHYKYSFSHIANQKRRYTAVCQDCGYTYNCITMGDLSSLKRRCCTIMFRASGIENGFNFERIGVRKGGTGSLYNITCIKCGKKHWRPLIFSNIKKIKHSCCDTYPFKYINTHNGYESFECEKCGVAISKKQITSYNLPSSCVKCGAVNVERYARRLSIFNTMALGCGGTIFGNEEFVKGTIVSELIEEKGLEKALELIKL